MPSGFAFARRSRPWRRLAVIGLTSVMVLSACQSTVTVELTDASPAADASGSSAGDSTSSPGQDESAAGEDGAEAETATGDTGDAPQPLFDLQGELPLGTEDVNSLITFVEMETGRSFLRPPVIVAQTTDEFLEGLEDDIVEFEASAERSVRSLQALGLTTKGVAEVSQAFVELLTSPEGIQGYYDPEPDQLYVPVGALGDDEFRSLLVHELTHALDGQHADLGALDALSEEAEITGNYEPVITLQAVGEGRATSVQNRWMRANGVSQPLPEDLGSGALADVPPALILSISIPYGFGEQFIEGRGGPSNTWDLLDTPPASSEEFMVPSVPAGETIIDIPTPPADGPILDEVVFGAADLFVWILGESLEPPPTLIFPTFAAIDGWAGGRSVVWGDDVESCTRITFAADSASDLSEIQDLLEQWAEGEARRSVALEGDRVTVTGCAPFVP